MNLPKLKIRSDEKQLNFGKWADKILVSRQAATTVVGDFFEEVASLMLGADRFMINSQCKCPDLILGDCLLESKAFNAYGGAVISIDQLFNYKFLAQKMNYRFYYIITVHRVKGIGDFETIEDLIDGLCVAPAEFFIIHYKDLWRLSDGKKIGVYETPTHKPFNFFRINRKDVMSIGSFIKTQKTITAYGREVNGILYGRKEWNSKMPLIQ